VTKKLSFSCLLFLLLLSPALLWGQSSKVPENQPLTLSQVFQLLETELMSLRLQSENEIAQLQILEGLRISDQNTILNLNSQLLKERQLSRVLQNQQEIDKRLLAGFKTSLTEAENSVTALTLRLEKEKVQRLFIGLGVGLVAGVTVTLVFN